jgi:tetratricopeptide (TPR) repeat protein
MSAPEPIATGTLAKTPLPHLLVYLDQKKLSGTLALWTDAQDESEQKKQDRILLLKGTPVAGRMIEPATTLREGLLKLFARTRAPYAFYETNLLGDDRISGRVDPISLITESLRSMSRDDVVEKVLARFVDTRLRIAAGVDLKRYEFTPEERGLVDLLLADPAPVAALVEGSGLPEARARRIVYLLAITKAIAPYDENEQRERPRSVEPTGDDAVPAETTSEVAAAGTTATSANADKNTSLGDGGMHSHLDRLHSIPTPPDDLAEELRQRWLRVIAKGRLIENQNYFEMLDLDKDAKATDARNKFYQMAKEWHPDRLPPELESVREYVQIIFSYMSEASGVLGDEQQRVKYVQTVREGGGTPATERLMQAILDTAMEYERVLVLSRRHEYDEAIEVLRKIIARVKDEPDYHAMYAWLLMQKFPNQEAPLQKMLESVNRALELHERHERANMLKGQILRRMGRHEEALKYFRVVADINPRNIEAVREVRVATMRTSKPPVARGGARKGKKVKDEGGVGGLIGKFFKRD